MSSLVWKHYAPGVIVAGAGGTAYYLITKSPAGWVLTYEAGWTLSTAGTTTTLATTGMRREAMAAAGRHYATVGGAA